VSPLEAIKNTGEIKSESLKKTRTSKITSKILGIEGEIARKNLRRNRKRFWITLFSMTLSIILFIVFSTFSNFMLKLGDMENSYRGDYEIFGQGDNGYDEIYNRVKDIEGIDRVYKRSSNSSNVEVLLEEEQISNKLMDKSENEHMFNRKKD